MDCDVDESVGAFVSFDVNILTLPMLWSTAYVFAVTLSSSYDFSSFVNSGGN
jgi:hypothetical protein